MGDGSILDQVFDFGQGIFKGWIDLETSKSEVDLAKLQRTEQAAEARRLAPVTGGGLLGNQTNILIIGLAFVVGMVLLPKILK